jgi:hypothetical protein
MVRAMSGRYYAAATMWGFALGAMVYRYGVLPFDWSSPWKHVLPGLAIGLAVAGQQLMRDADDGRKRPGVPVLLSLGVVGALIALGAAYLAFPTLDRLSIKPRQFPGFTLALPSGDVVEDRPDYAMGKLTLKKVGGLDGIVMVAWEMGEDMTEQDMQLVGELLTKAIGVKGATSTVTNMPGPGGKQVPTIVFTGDLVMTLSGLPCGGRHVIIATGGRHSVKSLHERIIGSFVCKPDPSQESTARIAFPLVIDLPGWYLSENEPDQIQITDGASALTLRTQDPNLKVDLEMIIEPMFKAAGVEGKVTSRQGARVNIEMSAEGEHMNGWTRLKSCPTGTAFVLALSADDHALDTMYEKVDAARCLAPGEKPQQWPAAPTGAPPPP